MQSLFQSVGHESRYHSHENVTDVPIENVVRESVRESTPLIATSIPPERRSKLALLFIVLMVLMLVSGVIIGSYLLIEQDKKWPVNMPFKLVKRAEWNAEKPKGPFLPLTTIPSVQLLVLQTGTKDCSSMESCQSTLLQIQKTFLREDDMLDLPFNFLIGGNGKTYEGRGYDVAGDVDPKLDESSIALAFIGNFKNKSPTEKQMEQSQAFIFESITTRKLVSNYRVIFKCEGPCTELRKSWDNYFESK